MRLSSVSGLILTLSLVGCSTQAPQPHKPVNESTNLTEMTPPLTMALNKPDFSGIWVINTGKSQINI